MISSLGITIAGGDLDDLPVESHDFDHNRSAGTISVDQSTTVQVAARVLSGRPAAQVRRHFPLDESLMVKEFRCRRFGRLSWLVRLVAVCAVLSLGLTYAATAGTMDWGVETIGGIMVVMQVALVILITPSLAAGLISSERKAAAGSCCGRRRCPSSASSGGSCSA